MNKNKAMPAGRQGFTLIELLIVIAIIGLLSGIVVISIKSVKTKSRDAQRVANINSLATSLSMYNNDHNAYPIYDGYIIGSDALSIALKETGTMTAVPIDPLNIGDYRYYYQSIDGEDYYLQYYLETISIQGKNQGLNYVVP
jgi:prepilin-type N-terminal cleavage/methylation domain-containing protein